MKVCDYHDIVHDSKWCPLCEVDEKIKELENNIKSLEDEIKNMEQL